MRRIQRNEAWFGPLTDWRLCPPPATRRLPRVSVGGGREGGGGGGSKATVLPAGFAFPVLPAYLAPCSAGVAVPGRGTCATFALTCSTYNPRGALICTEYIFPLPFTATCDRTSLEEEEGE